MTDASALPADALQPAAPLSAVNDVFRRALGHKAGIPGKFVMTAGIAALGDSVVYEIIRKVCAFDRFTDDNDPEGDHSFGAFEHECVSIFWKIDYYADADCEHGAENPSAQCFRVLTVLRADEW